MIAHQIINRKDQQNDEGGLEAASYRSSTSVDVGRSSAGKRLGFVDPFYLWGIQLGGAMVLLIHSIIRAIISCSSFTSKQAKLNLSSEVRKSK
jgi:hypothetical protein